MSLSVKEAAEKAYEFFKELYGDRYHNINIEEFEVSGNGKNWMITLGYDYPSPTALTTLQIAAGAQVKMLRGFKTFVVDREKGIIRAMKMKNE